MIELQVVNEVNGKSYGSKFETQEEANAYLDKQIPKQNWGKNERIITEDNISEELRSRIIATQIIPQVGEAVSEDGTIPSSIDYQPERTEHLVKADYVVTKIDLSIDTEYLASQVISNRKAEYPSIEEVIHAMLDDDLVSIQERRAAVKLKYPKA